MFVFRCETLCRTVKEPLSKIFSCTYEVDRREANISLWETKTLYFTLMQLWFPDTHMMNAQNIIIEYKSWKE